MAAFDDEAFDLVAFLNTAFDFDSVASSVASDGGDIWPARDNDPRWVAFLAAQGVSRTDHDINYDVRLALGRSLGMSDEACLSISVDDMWLRYKQSVGVRHFGAKDSFP